MAQDAAGWDRTGQHGTDPNSGTGTRRFGSSRTCGTAAANHSSLDHSSDRPLSTVADCCRVDGNAGRSSGFRVALHEQVG